MVRLGKRVYVHASAKFWYEVARMVSVLAMTGALLGWNDGAVRWQLD
jgi:hypothetical protein